MKINRQIFVGGADIGRYVIVAPEGGYVEAYLAEELARVIYTVTEKRVAVVTDASPAVPYEIRFGETKRTLLGSCDYDAYRVAVTENTVEAVAGTVFGYTDIFELLKNAVEAGELKAGTVWEGRAEHTPMRPSEFDLCFFFHNILGYQREYPVENRAAMGLQIYREYMPDILGLQEVSSFYYRDAATLWEGLTALGYDEIRFPRRGYGNPIYYNTKTLELVECGYQYARPGDKGHTWSVYIHRATNRMFALINSHFAADANAPRFDPVIGNEYRVGDAKALLKTIDMIAARYPDIPVFTGGDYNSCLGSDPINTLLAGGPISVRDVAERVTDCMANNGYPGYDPMERRYKYATYQHRDAAGNIDFATVAGNQKGVRLPDYTVLTDRISCTISDHLPHLLHVAFDK